MGTRNVLAAVLLIGAAGCGDATIKKLSANITRDSAFKILASELAIPDQMPHIYKEDQYLVDGKFYTVSFYTNTDRKYASDSVAGSAIADGDLVPLVFVNDTLTGWGWDHWSETASTINMTVTKP